MKQFFKSRAFFLFLPALVLFGCSGGESVKLKLAESFLNPPDSVRPGVYWYFMDGHLSREGMTRDLESMKEAGIGSVVFLEVNMGLPRGNVDFMSSEWMDLFSHARTEAERLGITIKLGIGPGWSGSGGPWVKPEQSMQFLVSSISEVTGGQKISVKLPRPEPMTPLFGEGSLTEDYKEIWSSYYRDVAVLAFPVPAGGSISVDFTKKTGHQIYGGIKAIKSYNPDFEEKALYYRPAYSSFPGVKQFIPATAGMKSEPDSFTLDPHRVVDLTGSMKPDGTLEWDAPAGRWTIMRFSSVNNGNLTRPAPIPGLGFECDKFDTAALNDHFNHFVKKLLPAEIKPYSKKKGGVTTIHMDSWEMGTQNWTEKFRSEFTTRRGYDPLPFYPCYSGIIVGSAEMTERFLWDLRLTSQELVIENHAEQVKRLGRKYGLRLSIEPYDINPTSDMELGAVADVPMCEFWLNDLGFNTAFSCIEAASIAHVLGKPVVAAESFTNCGSGFVAYPGLLKNQGDWAFCAGINQFYYHTFAHKPFDDRYRPGMTMGPCGIHWDRGQTFWPMIGTYHKYISRCSHMLQQGRTVASILYLVPEGAPHVFRPPSSATTGSTFMPDRKGYNFDGCTPGMLNDARVDNNRVVFSSGASYDLIVLPSFETMTPSLLRKIESLIKSGAVVTGPPPLESPSLQNHPECDSIVKDLSGKLWGGFNAPSGITQIEYGNGSIWWGGELSVYSPGEIYPTYEATAQLLKKLGVQEDFISDSGVRYTHRKTGQLDIYFVSASTEGMTKTECSFNVSDMKPELWDPLSGKIASIEKYRVENGRTIIPLDFDSYQSWFVVFDRDGRGEKKPSVSGENITKTEVKGPWNVSFDPSLGGPADILFDNLDDWTSRPEEGIKYYSGIATYRKTFALEKADHSKIFLSIGKVDCIARVRLNGKDLGVVWCAPWKTDITDASLNGENKLEIEVANLWINRLIGDERLPDDGISNGKFPGWLLKGEKRVSGRYAFAPVKFYNAGSPLQPSGLKGPVEIISIDKP